MKNEDIKGFKKCSFVKKIKIRIISLPADNNNDHANFFCVVGSCPLSLLKDKNHRSYRVTPFGMTQEPK